jgi:predicted nucleotidyltransferase
MEEHLPIEVESLVETIAPQLENTYALITLDDWSTIENIEAREASHALHYTLTDRNVSYALQLQTLASANGVIEDERVEGMMKKLIEFYDIYKSRVDIYYATQKTELDRLLSERADTTSAKKRTSKKTRTLSLAETEVKFQSTLSAGMLKLTGKFKKILAITDPSRITVETFNSTPIPLEMKIIT